MALKPNNRVNTSDANIQKKKSSSIPSTSSASSFSRRPVKIVQSTFLKFSVSQKGSKPVVINLSGKGNTPDYVNSIRQTRYADKANTGSVEIIYAPKGDQDPNFIEETLSKSDNGKCWIQYGNEGYKSRVYQGMITDYSTDLSQGYLRYTISFVSESVLTSFIKIKDIACDVPKPDIESLKAHQVRIDPSLRSISLGGFSEKDYYIDPEEGIIFNDANQEIKYLEKYGELLRTNGELSELFLNNYVLYTMYYIVDKYLPDYYKFDIKSSDTGFIKPQEGVPVQDLNPIQALKEIASQLIDSENPSVYHYTVVIEDSINTGTGRIYLKRVGVKSTDNVDLIYEFDWNSRDSDVISFQPKYSGQYLALGNSKIPSELTTSGVVASVDESGKAIYTTESYNTPPSSFEESLQENGSFDPGEMYRNSVKDTISFLKHANYPYIASLEVWGLPDTEVTLVETKVKVTPLINGKPHHSRGVYLVIGIEDSVGTDGFKTKLELVRLVDDNRMITSETKGGTLVINHNNRVNTLN